jgi:hypothetical protein
VGRQIRTHVAHAKGVPADTLENSSTESGLTLMPAFSNSSLTSSEAFSG